VCKYVLPAKTGKLHKFAFMENRKFSLEVIERNRITRISESVFGLLCLAGASWYAFSLHGPSAPGLSGWLSVIFLALFGIWEILSGAGLVSRYIWIGTDQIILRHRAWKSPVSLASSDLAEVKFKPLMLDFFLTGGKVISVRLGTYYSERSAQIMEAVEDFCTENRIKISGERNEQEKL
jgi:hypothetical protein